MQIVVFGIPAPQGSKSFKGMRGGHAILAESSKKVAPWRKQVKHAGVLAMSKDDQGRTLEEKRPPLDCPLVARMVFTMPKPKSAPKTRRTWPDRTPDLSKLVRSTEDALKDAGVIADDARIVEYSRIAKVFPGEDPEALNMPGVRITIGPIYVQAETRDLLTKARGLLTE
jgi:Holliday junction resolvase RusA-like endonuclease